MSWLIDDPTVLFVVLGIAALVLASSWWMTQKPAYATGLGVTAGLLVVVWLLSTLIDTDAKRIEQVAHGAAGRIVRAGEDTATRAIAPGKDPTAFAARAPTMRPDCEKEPP